jgi:glycosyltransferase involved in cell wall biosynthesis
MFASRFLKDKGIQEFVGAAEILKDRKIKFVLLGTPDFGNPTSIKQSELDSWIARGILEWWGFSAKTANFITKATIIVFPSYYNEGVPKILLEAAACGRPVITTNHPGCRDAVIDGFTGCLVPIKNSLLLATKIENLIADRSLLNKMSLNSRKLAEKLFDVNSVVDKHMKIYRSL